MPKKLLQRCPECGETWDIIEIENQECDACGWSYSKKYDDAADEVDEMFFPDED